MGYKKNGNDEKNFKILDNRYKIDSIKKTISPQLAIFRTQVYKSNNLPEIYKEDMIAFCNYMKPDSITSLAVFYFEVTKDTLITHLIKTKEGKAIYACYNKVSFKLSL